jgi:glycosyltransferase involved in cell wall biosynthesis
VVANVVDTDFFSPRDRPALDSETVRFSLIGRLAPRVKGVDVALQAASRLPRDRAWTIRIAGNGPERPGLERLTHELGLAERVEFLGYVQRPAIRGLLANTDFLLVPSRWETFGLVAVEAMAMGVPVIGAATGGLLAVIDSSTGVLVKVGDAESLREAMHSALEGTLRFDPNVLRASAESRFGVQAFLDRIDEVYARVLPRGAP